MINRLTANLPSIFLLCLVTFRPASAQEKLETDVWKLSGAIHIVEFTQSRFVDSLFTRKEKPFNRYKAIYDKQSVLSEISFLKPGGSIDLKIVYKYDENGRELERINYDPKNNVTRKIVHKYDDKGRLIEETTYDPHDSCFAQDSYTRNVFKYDDQRNEKEELDYDCAGRLVLRRLTKHNPNGTVKEESCENPISGYILCGNARWVYKYDEEANKIEMLVYPAKGKPERPTNPTLEASEGKQPSKVEWKYDRQGNQIEVNYGSMRITTSYSSHRLKDEETVIDKDGQITGRIKYDSKGNEILRVGRKVDGTLHKEYYQREFDSYGNCTKEVWSRKIINDPNKAISPSEWLKDEKDKGKVIQIIYQKITYYE